MTPLDVQLKNTIRLLSLLEDCDNPETAEYAVDEGHADLQETAEFIAGYAKRTVLSLEERIILSEAKIESLQQAVRELRDAIKSGIGGW